MLTYKLCVLYIYYVFSNKMLPHWLHVHTPRELGHSSNVFKCHLDLGLFHLREHHPALALGCFREASKVARERRNHQGEAEVLKEMGQVGVANKSQPVVDTVCNHG